MGYLHADPYAFRLYSIVHKDRSFEKTYDTKKMMGFFRQIQWYRVWTYIYVLIICRIPKMW
ncbi:hypothetical protein AB205_0035400 [Aquarana catesbeiana]|uniref:Uncharacterized protein n=1 Tax=Aquarana catesbeiana TaxID=8400 RepID=A0A2G9R8L1_AQUCT|nr:hypothetical protein AB205_0035400 [Aquarana catesbeiana]